MSVSGAPEYLGPDGLALASGGDAPAPMASISKLVTALVVLDRKPLGASGVGPTITFDRADNALYDKYFVLNATIAAMPTGSSMSEHDAIETMLVVSASNYAEAVSTWAFGSQPAFLTAARTWLARNGLVHTRLVEPTGIDARNVSTPSDLIALGRLAMADPAVAAIVATQQLDVPGLDPQANTNDLLGGGNGVNGIKTGTLDGYGSNILFSASIRVADGQRGAPQPLTVIGVMLGQGDHGAANGDVEAFIRSLQAGFHPVTVAKADQEVGTIRTAWGGGATAVLESQTSLLTWSNTPITSSMTTTGLGAGRSGQRVGSVTFTGDTQTATVPIVLKGSIRPPDAWWRLTHPGVLFGGR